MLKLTSEIGVIARAVQQSTVLQLSADRKMVRKRPSVMPAANDKQAPAQPKIQYGMFQGMPPIANWLPQYYPNNNGMFAPYPNSHPYVQPDYPFQELPCAYPRTDGGKEFESASDATPNQPKKPRSPSSWSSSPSSSFVLMPPCPPINNEPISSSYLSTMLTLQDVSIIT